MAYCVDFAAQSELDSFVYAIFGGYTTVSAAKYMSLIDEDGAPKLVLVY